MKFQRQKRIIKKKAEAILGVCAVMTSLLIGCGGQPEVAGQTGDPEPASPVSRQESGEVSSKGLPWFSKDLFSQGIREKNPLISPVSAYLALSLTGSGATGDTATEFEEVLGADHQAVSQMLLTELPADREGMQISLADSVWLDEQLTPGEHWQKTAEERYQAQVYRRKLSTPETRDCINAWIEESTKGLIQNFLQEDLTENMRLALFNTIYFKGDWESPFSGDATYDEVFYPDGGDTVKTPMMHKYNKTISYIKFHQGDGIVLPYQNSDLVFVALKPAEGMTVREMYDALDMDQLPAIVQSAEDKKLDLMLPKFEITFDRILNEDLQNLGLVSAFDAERADFSEIGISDGGTPLYIGIVRQKAVFILDEEGTEAAAVTAVELQTNSAMIEEPPVQVYFNEPFFYMIYDSENNLPLFMGILDEPTE